MAHFACETLQGRANEKYLYLVVLHAKTLEEMSNDRKEGTNLTKSLAGVFCLSIVVFRKER
jgi:hypothetical protein